MTDTPITIYHNPNCGTSRTALGLIEAAGHYPHLERPELFTRKIVDFVAQAPGRGR